MTTKKSYTAEGHLLTQLILETFRFNGRLISAGDNLTKDLGLTSARWQVLGAITASDIPLTVPSIARNMGLQRQSVQRLVDALEEESFVQLSDNPHHKRARLVTLTKKGKEVFENATKLQIPWVNQLATGIETRKLENALELMRELRTRFEDV